MDEKNHHLHKPVFIGEVKADGQFNVVWKTQGPVKAQPWSPFIAGNDKKKDEPEAWRPRSRTAAGRQPSRCNDGGAQAPPSFRRTSCPRGGAFWSCDDFASLCLLAVAAHALGLVRRDLRPARRSTATLAQPATTTTKVAAHRCQIVATRRSRRRGRCSRKVDGATARRSRSGRART